MSREEQIQVIIDWLRKHTSPRQASMAVRLDEADEAFLRANPEGLRLFAADLLEASLKIEQAGYVEDIEQAEHEPVYLPRQPWLDNAAIPIVAPGTRALSNHTDSDTDEDGQALQKTWRTMGIIVVAIIVIALVIGLAAGSWFKK